MTLTNIALKNIKRRRGKTLLVMAGVALAAAAVVVIVMMIGDFKNQVNEQLEKYGYNLAVAPTSHRLSLSYGGMSVAGISATKVKPLNDDVLKKVREAGGRDIWLISPKIFQLVKIKNGQGLLAGVDFKTEQKAKKWWQIGFGRFPAGDREVMVGEVAADKLKIKTGDTLNLSGHKYRVVGILFQTGTQDDEMLFTGFNSLRRRWGRGREISLLEIATKAGAERGNLAARLKRAVKGADVIKFSQVEEFNQRAMARILDFGLAVTMLVVFISIMIIFTTTTSSVNERRREIGIFRAIGYKRRQIIKIMMTEILVVSLAAGVFGYLLGMGAAQAIRVFNRQAVGMDSRGALLLPAALLLSALIAVGAGIIPTRRAAGLDPVESLKEL